MCEQLLMVCKGLSDPALPLITAVCPGFSLNPSFTVSPCNLTPFPVCVSAVRTRCQQPGAPCKWMWCRL